MRLGGFAWTAVLCVALIPHCGAPCADGAPCSESEVGHTCGGTTCTAFVCDGVQYGPVPKQVGDPCDSAGTTCSTTGSKCGGAALVCKSNRLVDVSTNQVGPNLPCNDKGLVCHFPETECQTCTCSGAQWVCQVGACCVAGCGEAGTCPPSSTVVAGDPCGGSPLTCSSDYACGNASPVSGSCSCTNGTWTCVAPCDAGTDADGD